MNKYLKNTILSLIFLNIFFPLGCTNAEEDIQTLTRDTNSTRMPAEWEPHTATWMQWPTEWENFLRSDFAKIINVIRNYEPVHLLVLNSAMENETKDFLIDQGVLLTNIIWHIVSYDNSWLRDNGPVYVFDKNGLWVQDWNFDAWGGNFGETIPYQNDNTIPLKIAGILNKNYENKNSYILERGNLECNGKDTVILNWDCQNDRNPEWTREQTNELFRNSFGVSQVIWTEGHSPFDNTTGHIDGALRFVSEDTVAVARSLIPGDPDAQIYEDAATVTQNAGLNVVRMDIPGTINFKGEALPAIYMNWLVGNGFVAAQGFGNSEWDNAAKVIIEGFFPGRDVHMIVTNELWYNGGGIHCVTNDQPAETN